MIYQILKPLFFNIQPEEAHHLIMNLISTCDKIPGIKSLWSLPFQSKISLPTEVAGLHFKNPIGLAAGFDKNAQYLKPLSKLGFGFIEIGTVTPKPQDGNPKPRLFRIVEDEAIINRMGFNNMGVHEVIENLKNKPKETLIGGNIGKNKVTPNEEAVNDYVYCFENLFDHVDYFVVNVSSPNTPNLRDLQDKEPLLQLMKTLQTLNNQKINPKPIFLKIAPDLTFHQLSDILQIYFEANIAGIVATNTTVERTSLTIDKQSIDNIGAGGLSGRPLTKRSSEVIRFLYKESGFKIPIIGVGGVFTADDAKEKLDAGAKLVQVYSGFIYEGPNIVKKILTGIKPSRY